MAQKKAFVRYANNKAVPGSLIVRTKAPKVGTWKEVPYDVCCDSGGCCKKSTTIFSIESVLQQVSAPYTEFTFQLYCKISTEGKGIYLTGNLNYDSPGWSTLEDLINDINLAYNKIIEFKLISPTEMSVSYCLPKQLCFDNNCPGQYAIDFCLKSDSLPNIVCTTVCIP